MDTKDTFDYIGSSENLEKVVLLYSGGLDTSCMVKHIQEEYGAEVVTLTLDLGQPGVDLELVKEKALEIGALEAEVIDVKEEFAKEYLSKCIQLNGKYQKSYPLSTALARYLVCEKAVEIAEEHDADAIAHGSTGKGNDQVRFEAGILALDPEMKLLAPVRQWSMTRDKELEYAEEHGIPVEATEESPYSTDENLWGKSSECGPLEDPATAPPEDVFEFVQIPEEAPEEFETVGIKFQEGVPVALNGAEMKPHELIKKLNGIAGKHGVGIIDTMEDRVVGLKSREVYECPAAITILEAHKELEKFVCTKHENRIKQSIDQEWAEYVYNGLYFDPAVKHLEEFASSMNQKVSGTVKVKLYKGSATVVSRESENGLYDKELASYEAGETFNQEASPGFIELWSLQTKLSGETGGEN